MMLYYLYIYVNYLITSSILCDKKIEVCLILPVDTDWTSDWKLITLI